MIIFEYPGENKICGDCVLALGLFDGVHVAHRDLILTAKTTAVERGLPLGIFTFDKGIKSDAPKIYSNIDRAELFEKLGADFVVFADFNQIKDTSPEDFVNKILCKKLRCRVAVAGFNFRFGRSASGNADTLNSLMQKSGGEAIIKQEITGKDGKTVSSTRIRELLSKKKLNEANILLGEPYFINGNVCPGNQKGRELGFPTFNTPIPHGVIAPTGVFRSIVNVDGKTYNAITNIGTCPTLGARDIHAETHIIDYSGNLYGKQLKTYLLGFLRDEMHFDSAEELCKQIEKDIKITIGENKDYGKNLD